MNCKNSKVSKMVKKCLREKETFTHRQQIIQFYSLSLLILCCAFRFIIPLDSLSLCFFHALNEMCWVLSVERSIEQEMQRDKIGLLNVCRLSMNVSFSQMHLYSIFGTFEFFRFFWIMMNYQCCVLNSGALLWITICRNSTVK